MQWLPVEPSLRQLLLEIALVLLISVLAEAQHAAAADHAVAADVGNYDAARSNITRGS